MVNRRDVYPPAPRLLSTRCAALALAAVWGAVLGCGGPPPADADRSVVSGAVTFDGQPLPAGTITFESKAGGLVTQVPIREGRYTTDRAPVGSNYVSVDTASIQYGNPAAYVPIPARYADPGASGLEAEIKPGESVSLDFALSK